MGKKKGKKVDVEKKAALQAKKEAKQEKAARKRLAKEQGKSFNQDDDDEEDDIDQVLQAYKNSQDTQNKTSEAQDGTTTAAAKDKKPSLENIDTEFPLPRANATLTTLEGGQAKDPNFYLFGGEYYDGIENIVLDELVRYDATKQEWKLIRTYPKPPPRCAHSCVSYKNSLYVFGGEMATADQYHHYRDLWKFDTQTLQWTEITARNPPSARSGHVCYVWKSYMIVFGGFFEAVRETKWYNDIHVLNLQTETWLQDINPSRLSQKPDPRSACNFASYGQDKILIHGGFSKLKKTATQSTNSAGAETKVHTDSWLLNLTPIVQQKPPTWERWMSSSKGINGTTANGRAGTSSVSYKNRMLVFGGVVDSELHHHMLESIFYNDLMALDIERRKWFPLRMKTKKTAGSGSGSSGRRRKQNQVEGEGNNDEDAFDKNANESTANDDDNDDDDDGDSDLELEEEDDDDDADDNVQQNTGWDLDTLRANMFAFVDGDGNIIYEKIDEEEKETKQENDGDDEEEEESKDDDEDDEEKEEEKEEEMEEDEESKDDDTPKEAPKICPSAVASKNASKKVTSSSVLALNPETNVPEAVKRTEPLPRINASIVVRGHTMYVLGGILEVGDREVTLDDMWAADLRKRDKWECIFEGTMHKQVWRGAVHDDDDSYISSKADDDEEMSDYDFGFDDEGSDVEASGDVNKSEKKKSSKRSGLRQEISELNEQYSLDDENRTPNGGESLADFYSRTSVYWNEQAAEKITGTDQELSNKELKREGFSLAKERFEELKPILERLAELSIGAGSSKSKSKDEKKKKDKKEKKKSKKEK